MGGSLCDQQARPLGKACCIPATIDNSKYGLVEKGHSVSDTLTLYIALRFLRTLRQEQEGAPDTNLELYRKALTLARERVALARTIERSIRILANEGVGQEVLTSLSARVGDLLRSY